MSSHASLDIPQEILDSARLSLDEVRTELALSLYGAGRLSLGKARELADMTLWRFRQLVATRKIAPHYDIEDIQEDLETLRELGRL